MALDRFVREKPYATQLALGTSWLAFGVPFKPANDPRDNEWGFSASNSHLGWKPYYQPFEACEWATLYNGKTLEALEEGEVIVSTDKIPTAWRMKRFA